MMATDTRVQVPHGGNPGSPFTTIGHVELHETRKFTVDTSYAAWWYEVECQPQTVPLESNGYYLRWEYAGVVTGGNIDSRIGGVPITPNQIGHSVGMPMSKWFMPYAYMLDEYLSGELHEQYPFPFQTLTLGE